MSIGVQQTLAHPEVLAEIERSLTLIGLIPQDFPS
jgi:hypothetical protein